MNYTYLIRERALVMAQMDWHAGKIDETAVVAKALQYEAYLTGSPQSLLGETQCQSKSD